MDNLETLKSEYLAQCQQKPSLRHGRDMATIERILDMVEDPDDRLDATSMKAAFEEALKDYTGNKHSAVIAYNNFMVWLQGAKGAGSDDGFIRMPVNVSDKLERIVHFLKKIPESTANAEGVTNELYVSKRVAESDIATITGRMLDEVFMCVKRKGEDEEDEEQEGREGQEDREGGVRSGGKLISDSTLQPIFILANLGEILMLLGGLKTQSEKYSGYSEQTARVIWWQLSRYARERLLDLVRDRYGDSLEWFERLDSSTSDFEPFFLYERHPTGTLDRLLHCLRSKIPCDVECADESDDVEHYKGYVVSGLEDDIVTLRKGRKEVRLEMKSIRSVSFDEKSAPQAAMSQMLGNR
ncbi:MAG: hypothetical protein LBR22_05610 [Desulfovibrio sp.]|jgi:hypothetical protein|nr:hypothetical protein [Desulfovibrio sp.]